MGHKQAGRQGAAMQGYGGPVCLQLLPDFRCLTWILICGTHVTLKLAYKVLKRAFKELLENLLVTSSQCLFSRWLRELECKAVVVMLSCVVITCRRQINDPATVILHCRH